MCSKEVIVIRKGIVGGQNIKEVDGDVNVDVKDGETIVRDSEKAKIEIQTFRS